MSPRSRSRSMRPIRLLGKHGWLRVKRIKMGKMVRIRPSKARPSQRKQRKTNQRSQRNQRLCFPVLSGQVPKSGLLRTVPMNPMCTGRQGGISSLPCERRGKHTRWPIWPGTFQVRRHTFWAVCLLGGLEVNELIRRRFLPPGSTSNLAIEV